MEECHGSSVAAFRWDREHACDQRGVLGVPERAVLEERVDRAEPDVAGAGAVAAFLFEVVEERADQLGIEIVDAELVGRLAGPL